MSASLGSSLEGMPWWVTLIGVSLWPVAYICRWLAILLLDSKALDKADSAQIPAIMTAMTRHRADDGPGTLRRRRDPPI